MKRKSLLLAFAVAAWVTAAPAQAPDKLNVVATLPDYAFVAERLGGDRVSVSHIVRGDQDAHFIRPKPSFVRMVQKADVLVATGLDLELWLPTVVDKSGNGRVRSGMEGYVAASQGMPLLEKPGALSRIEGGLHVYGNPHVTVSPLQMKVAARNIAVGLAKSDPAGRDLYMRNLDAFLEELDRRLFGEELLELLGSRSLTRLGESGKLVSYLHAKSWRGKPLADYAGGWLGKMLPLRSRPVVTYHKNWIYFLRLFGLEEAGTVEPKPGIPPSPKHVAELKETMRKRDVRILLAANYFDEAKARAIAESVGAVPVIVPLYVGGAEGTGDYFSLVDLWVDSLVAAAGKAGVVPP
jgi:ABC-type Zn uptake system ZnuABC Zn-binding protein ZnuA